MLIISTFQGKSGVFCFCFALNRLKKVKTGKKSHPVSQRFQEGQEKDKKTQEGQEETGEQEETRKRSKRAQKVFLGTQDICQGI